ncbi:MAG: hypothetical protein DHS20C05_03760 [Hyphococcus sp.]|nr:MAG: hypothetical protein DHS20C05_03760 [Marinicaulis sp.]
MTHDLEQKHDKKSNSKSLRFVWVCSGLLLGVIAIFAFAMQLEIFDAGPHVVFAMVAGVFATILLGVGLMALAFHSDDSGIDDHQ